MLNNDGFLTPLGQKNEPNADLLDLTLHVPLVEFRNRKQLECGSAARLRRCGPSRRRDPAGPGNRGNDASQRWPSVPSLVSELALLST